MKQLILFAFLAACGGESVHDVVACRAWPSMPDLAGKQCERGCDMQPSNWDASGEDMPCTAEHPDRNDTQCPRTFVTDDIRGCCVGGTVSGLAVRYEFYACQ